MARLNEAPVPTESVDALKRRFIRQNRELAKNNSTQSIRIRNLEIEQTRLVAENLSLRERIIELEAQLEKDRRNNAIQNIGAVKDKLEAKIHELSILVSTLGLVQKPSLVKETSRSPKLSPSLIAWRHARIIDPAFDEGRLPTISEGRHFPRKTLDAEELRRISIDASNDSPDLGPPPVAHFQDEHPISFNPRSSTRSGDPNAQVDDADSVPAAMSVNLETRRRRRESANRSEIKRIESFSSSPDNPTGDDKTESAPPAVKVGAKRKLSAREDDRAQPEIVKESFRFSRKTQPQQLAASQTETSDKDKSESQPEVAKTKPRTITERRVLGAKSVNTDPVVSPRKASRSMSADNKPEFKKPTLPIREAVRQQVRDKKTRSGIAPQELAEIKVPAPLSIAPETADIPPATPAGLDLFSPPSTQPSTGRPETKDTPPPRELKMSSTLGMTDEMAAAGAGRAARRARAQVNYAEPNLVSKMRRPTKEFAPAVVDKPRTSIVDLTTADSSQPRSTFIKRERNDTDDESWKTLPIANGQNVEPGEPNSPLSKKTGTTKVYDIGQTAQEELEEENLKSSASAAAIAELLATASSSRRLSRFSSVGSTAGTVAKGTTTKDEAVQRVRGSKTELGMSSSSPEDLVSDSAPCKSSQDSLNKIRSSRRHSSVGQLSAIGMGSKTGEVNRVRTLKDGDIAPEESDVGEARETVAPRGERAMARRKSMMI